MQSHPCLYSKTICHLNMYFQEMTNPFSPKKEKKKISLLRTVCLEGVKQWVTKYFNGGKY